MPLNYFVANSIFLFFSDFYNKYDRGRVIVADTGKIFNTFRWNQIISSTPTIFTVSPHIIFIFNYFEQSSSTISFCSVTQFCFSSFAYIYIFWASQHHIVVKFPDPRPLGRPYLVFLPVEAITVVVVLLLLIFSSVQWLKCEYVLAAIRG